MTEEHILLNFNCKDQQQRIMEEAKKISFDKTVKFIEAVVLSLTECK
ncbi:MAG TPA: hypothetical protein VN704_01710 [Verrucomicrobiae bacterium]|nr:hypothetical protein [Verrucomicrobiae bacterium]